MATRGHALHLIARDAEELMRICSDLQTRYSATVTWSTMDALQPKACEKAFADSVNQLGTVDGVFFATGVLGNEPVSQVDADSAAEIAEINYVSALRFLTTAANYLEQRRQGFIVAITSVAGDRGRPSNYVYGSAKGALSLFLQGMRARLHKRNVHVMTVKPGFVDTKMTFGKSGMFLVAQPDQVGKAIVKALDARKDVVCIPSFWALIMLIIKLVPEPLFKRLKL
jgi:short-subunit dehydrogenase